jgi:hypothetical protein
MLYLLRVILYYSGPSFYRLADIYVLLESSIPEYDIISLALFYKISEAYIDRTNSNRTNRGNSYSISLILPPTPHFSYSASAFLELAGTPFSHIREYCWS